MRTFGLENDISVICNSDLSGDIEVVNTKTNVRTVFTFEELQTYFLYNKSFPSKFVWVKEFFANLAREKIISAVEQMSDDEVLKFELYLEA